MVNDFIISILITGIALPIVFAVRNYYQFRGNSSKWHIWQGVLQVLFFIFVGYATHYQIGLIAAFLFWALFDVSIGQLHKGDFFYMGDTAMTDRIWKKIFKGFAGEMAFIIKMLIVIAIISIYFVTNF